MRRDDSAAQVLFHGNSIPMWVVDRETGRFLDVNDAALDTYRYDRNAFLALDAEQLRAEAPIPGQAQSAAEVSLDRPGHFTHWRSDGSTVQVELNSQALNYEGRPALLVSVRDMTDQLRIQGALQESEGRLRAVFDALPDGVCLHSEGTCLYANRAFERIFGFPEGAATGISILDIVPESERHRAAGGWQGSGLLETYGVTRSGSVFPVEVSTVNHDFQERPARLSVIRDASERKLMLDLLRDSESRYRSLFEHNLAGVFRTDADGNFYDCNEACARILGYGSRRELLSRDAREFYFESDGRGNFLEALQQKGFLANHELCLRRRDGSTVWVLENVTLSHPEPDGPSVIEGTLIDITDRKLVERLDQEQAELLEMIAQDLPLGSVLDHLARMVEHQSGEARCLVFLKLEGALVISAAPGLPSSALAALDPTILQQAFESHPGDPEDASWTAYRAWAEAQSLVSCASAPVLSSRGEVQGLIVLHSSTGRSHGRSVRDLLVASARLASLALERSRLSERLVHQAQYDALTGLPNSLLFRDRLSQALHLAQRQGQRLAVMFIDLDGFKRVNDGLGHQAGDQLLGMVAGRFRTVVRNSDTLARMGGDEFMLVLGGIRTSRAPIRVAEKLLRTLQEPIEVAGQELVVSASIGISFYPEDGVDQESLLRHADAAMYKAKASGRNGFQCYTAELNSELLDRMELEQQLRQALSRGELRLAYQPQHLAGGRLVGFEALLRWSHTRWGSVSPSRFIPVAEECGLILPIGKWVLEEACRQCSEWRGQGHPDLRVAVNVSALQFEQADWNRTVARALDSARLHASGLELEITEGLIMQDATSSTQRLKTVREMGVALAIDDFGTGYSSLAYLQRLPVDTLKIDQSFIHALEAGGGSRHATAIVEAIVNLGQGLGMQVLAEGVETHGQLEFLRRTGCHAMQGYLFGKPMGREEAGAYLAASPL